MSGTTTNLTEVYAKELQDAQEKYVECHHVFIAAKECVSLLKSQDAPLTCGQKQHLEKVEASLPELEAALFEAEEELESANISYSFRRFAPSTATASIPVAVPLAATASIFTTERSEFGMYKFADPCRQATYEHHETRYTKMLKVKNAYDRQELLRKMRADMKREYLTRKNQVTRLQKDAAIDFRNAESSLQEHYATEAADHHPYIRAVDITAPLVSRIQLPRGEILDLKTFDANHEFAKVRQIHEDLRRDQEEQEQEQRRFEEQEQEQSRWWEANADALAKWEQRNYEQRRPYAPRGEEQQQQQEEEQPGRYGDGGYCGCNDLECSDCYSYGNQNDDQSSYDSEYDGLFPRYPPEYNCERECREAEEAEAARQAAIQQQWMEKTHNDAYQQACDAFVGSDDETWDEEARANEAEHRREVAQMRLNDDLNYTCDDYPDVQQLEVVAITEPRERVTASAAASSGGISAKKKASAGAAKARIAKQQRKKKQQQQTKQFVPIQITVNTNRVTSDETESASSTLLYQGKAEINLPKKNLQNVSREGKKRDAEKWRRINAAEKQSNARGTRITNIPEPRAWHNCGGSDNEWDFDY